MRENEFTLDGVKYISKKIVDTMSCEGCAAIEIGSDLCVKFPDCFKSVRFDGMSVIFVEKHP